MTKVNRLLLEEVPVYGPSSSLNNTLPVFDGTTGKLIKDSGILIADVGTGNVVGPASSVNNRIAVFDGTTGKIIKDSGILISDVGTPPLTPQGRLSLVSGVPLPTNDVTGAVTIYYVAAQGTSLPIYDGTKFVNRNFGTQIAHPLDNNPAHTLYQENSSLFDEWAFWDGSTVKLGNGPKWPGPGSSRGTGAGTPELEMFLGFLVNKNSMQVRWGSGAGDITTIPARQATLLGSFVTTAAGQATDSKYRRLLSNAYNLSERILNENPEPAANWNYGTAAFRVSNGNANTQTNFVCCLDSNILKVTTKTKLISTTSAVVVAGMGIGIDGVVGVQDYISVSDARYELIYLFLETNIGLGYHYVQPFEYGSGSVAQTWVGGGGRVWGTILN